MTRDPNKKLVVSRNYSTLLMSDLEIDGLFALGASSKLLGVANIGSYLLEPPQKQGGYL